MNSAMLRKASHSSRNVAQRFLLNIAMSQPETLLPNPMSDASLPAAPLPASAVAPGSGASLRTWTQGKLGLVIWPIAFALFLLLAWQLIVRWARVPEAIL